MRQGGMVPKNHDSGVYWVRANANSGNQSMEDDDKGGFGGLCISILVILFIVCALVASCLKIYSILFTRHIQSGI